MPEIVACDATTVAAVASATMGYSAHAGVSRKNGFSIAFGSPISSAPWPK